MRRLISLRPGATKAAVAAYQVNHQAGDKIPSSICIYSSSSISLLSNEFGATDNDKLLNLENRRNCVSRKKLTPAMKAEVRKHVLTESHPLSFVG